jgi:MraZ protein
MVNLGKPLYAGIHRHSLDDKNRLTIPSAWRAAHAESGQFLVVPLEGFLSVLPPEEALKLHEKVSAKSLSDAEAQQEIAVFFSEALAFNFDKSGRVMLTPELCTRAGIGKEVVLTGAGNKFNLYSPEEWTRVQAASSAQKAGDRLRRIGI